MLCKFLSVALLASTVLVFVPYSKALGSPQEAKQAGELAEWQRQVNNSQEQIAKLRQAIKENERNERGKLLRPRLYTLLGESLIDLCYLYSIANMNTQRAASAEEAKRAFQASVIYGGQPAQALDGSGRAASCAEDYLSAIDYYKRTLQVDPRIPALHRNLGIAYVKLGRFRNAREVLEVAVRNDPDDAPARFHLASVYLQLDLPLLAKEQCETIRELGMGALCSSLKFDEVRPHD
jgi:tetratricopeptide (TPR) repeat protein